MAKANAVTKLRPDPLPAEIEIDTTRMAEIAMAPNELRELRKQTGKGLTELLGEEATDEDRLQVMVWLRLRRDGHQPTWDEAGDVAVIYRDVPVDPTSGASSTGPPGSVGIGA